MGLERSIGHVKLAECPWRFYFFLCMFGFDTSQSYREFSNSGRVVVDPGITVIRLTNQGPRFIGRRGIFRVARNSGATRCPSLKQCKTHSLHLFFAQQDHRIDGEGAPGGEPRRDKTHTEHSENDTAEDDRVLRRGLIDDQCKHASSQNAENHSGR